MPPHAAEGAELGHDGVAAPCTLRPTTEPVTVEQEDPPVLADLEEHARVRRGAEGRRQRHRTPGPEVRVVAVERLDVARGKEVARHQAPRAVQ